MEDEVCVPSEEEQWQDVYDAIVEQARLMPANLARALAAQILNENPVPRHKPKLIAVE